MTPAPPSPSAPLSRRDFIRTLVVSVSVLTVAPKMLLGGKTKVAMIISGLVLNHQGLPVEGATVVYGVQTLSTDSNGRFELEYNPDVIRIEVSMSGMVGYSVLNPQDSGTQLVIPDIKIFPDDLSIGLDVDDDGIPDNLTDFGPRLLSPIVEMTADEAATFLEATPAFADIRALVESLGFTEADPLVFLARPGNVGQSFRTPDDSHQVTILSVPPDSFSEFPGSVLAAGLGEEPNTIEFFNLEGTQFVLDAANEQFIFTDPTLGTISFEALEEVGEHGGDDLTPKQRFFVKWLKEEEGLSKFWLQLILAGYITLIFGPLGWVACFVTLWFVSDALERCKDKANKEFLKVAAKLRTNRVGRNRDQIRLDASESTGNIADFTFEVIDKDTGVTVFDPMVTTASMVTTHPLPEGDYLCTVTITTVDGQTDTDESTEHIH